MILGASVGDIVIRPVLLSVKHGSNGFHNYSVQDDSKAATNGDKRHWKKMFKVAMQPKAIALAQKNLFFSSRRVGLGSKAQRYRLLRNVARDTCSNHLLLIVLTLISTSWPGWTSPGKSMSNFSLPDKLCVSAFSPSRNCKGTIPIPTRLDRWIRSNDSAITARTPCKQTIRRRIEQSHGWWSPPKRWGIGKT